jgi:hypothetical protein
MFKVLALTGIFLAASAATAQNQAPHNSDPSIARQMLKEDSLPDMPSNPPHSVNLWAASGTRVQAPADGTVTRVWNNGVGGLTVEILLTSNYRVLFNHLSAANYKAGMGITRGMALGQSGTDEDGRAYTNYSMIDPSGNFIDPTKASSDPTAPKNFHTPEDEEKVIESINQNEADPEMRKIALDHIRQLANANREILNREYAESLHKALDAWYMNNKNWRKIPTDLWTQLTERDRGRLKEGIDPELTGAPRRSQPTQP